MVIRHVTTNHTTQNFNREIRSIEIFIKYKLTRGVFVLLNKMYSKFNPVIYMLGNPHPKQLAICEKYINLEIFGARLLYWRFYITCAQHLCI